MVKNDDLTQIKELIEIVKHKVDMMEVSRTGQSATLQLMKDQLSVVNKKLDDVGREIKEVKDTQENRVLPSVIETEATLKGYADSYKENQHNIERVDTRLTAVEDKLDIDTPEELKVPHFTD